MTPPRAAYSLACGSQGSFRFGSSRVACCLVTLQYLELCSQTTVTKYGSAAVAGTKVTGN